MRAEKWTKSIEKFIVMLVLSEETELGGLVLAVRAKGRVGKWNEYHERIIRHLSGL
jgi:hypothetical protein